jgi:hypothetical protein
MFGGLLAKLAGRASAGHFSGCLKNILRTLEKNPLHAFASNAHKDNHRLISISSRGCTQGSLVRSAASSLGLAARTADLWTSPLHGKLTGALTGCSVLSEKMPEPHNEFHRARWRRRTGAEHSAHASNLFGEPYRPRRLGAEADAHLGSAIAGRAAEVREVRCLTNPNTNDGASFIQSVAINSEVCR